MQFNKIKNACSFAVAIAICYSPITTLAEEQAPSYQALIECIDNHEITRNLEEEINTRQLSVYGTYSEYEIAERNLIYYATQLSDITERLSETKKTGIERARLSASQAKAEAEIIKWTIAKDVALIELSELMYGINLKIERLKNIRIGASPCKELTYTITDKRAVCSTRSDTRWCKNQF